ncbi:Fe-S biogenesis protein NfuA, partial [Erwinia amylovora]|nr:Fe-S biogenesis protein NfuA [Erwinia amylovora]
MILITDSAQEQFAKLLSKPEDGTQMRGVVINEGPATAECGDASGPPAAEEATD